MLNYLFLTKSTQLKKNTNKSIFTEKSNKTQQTLNSIVYSERMMLRSPMKMRFSAVSAARMGKPEARVTSSWARCWTLKAHAMNDRQRRCYCWAVWSIVSCTERVQGGTENGVVENWIRLMRLVFLLFKYSQD